MRKFLRLTGFLAGLFLLLLSPAADAAEKREVVILYTNDFHSAIDPIPAYWLDERPIPKLGGAAELMTFVEQIREREAKAGNPVFLFDTGDMFTGMLSKLTQGEALMEMMHTMGYDALGIGNHEFDYGWENFRKQMFRVPFPCLGANIFYKSTGIPFSPPHTILERNGDRIGVIGIIGQDAKSVVLPSFVTELDFQDRPLTFSVPSKSSSPTWTSSWSWPTRATPAPCRPMPKLIPKCSGTSMPTSSSVEESRVSTFSSAGMPTVESKSPTSIPTTKASSFRPTALALASDTCA